MEVLTQEQVRAIQGSFNQTYGDLSHQQINQVLDSFHRSWGNMEKAEFFDVGVGTISRWKRGASTPAGKNKMVFHIWLDLLNVKIDGSSNTTK